MAREKRGNAQFPLIQDTPYGESSARHDAYQPELHAMQQYSAQNPQSPVQYPPRNTPEYTSSAGFFQGSNGVEVNGGRFNQTYGHQTNVTIHVNRQREEESDLLQPEPRPSTSQLPVPIDSFSNAHPPEIIRMSYTPDNSNKIYERHLGLKQRGFPLWIPEPNRRLPMAYRRRGIHIGDVGIITPSGGFSFLFNICRPHGDPINPSTLPEGFAAIYPPLEPMDVREFSEFKPESYLASTKIERVNNDPPFLGLSFQTSAAEGAILTIPEGAVALDLENIPRFRAYAAANVESWYRYVNGPRGREAKNGEVRLVIGCDKTTSWGMASVANISQHKVHYLRFRSIEEASTSSTSSIPLYRWEYSGLAEARVGPDLAEIEELKRDDDAAVAARGRYWNQCIFVRTLNLTLSDEIFEAISRDVEAALIEEFRQFQPKGSNTASRSSHSNASTQTGDTNGPSQNRTGTQEDSSELNLDKFDKMPVKKERVTTSVSVSAIKSHPADVLNKKLLQRAPKCRVAITEDSNWYSVLTEDDKIMPTPDEIATRVFVAHNIREEDGVAYLEPKQGHSHVIRPRRPFENRSDSPNLPLTRDYSALSSSTARAVRDSELARRPPSRTATLTNSPTLPPEAMIHPLHIEHEHDINLHESSFARLRRESQNSTVSPYLGIRIVRIVLLCLQYLTNSRWCWALLAFISLLTQLGQLRDNSPRLQAASRSVELVITVLFDMDIASRIFETWSNWGRLLHVETWIDVVSAVGSTVILSPGIRHSGMYFWFTFFPLMRLYRLSPRHLLRALFPDLHRRANIALFLVAGNYAVAIFFIRNYIQYDAFGPKVVDLSSRSSLILSVGSLWLFVSNVFIFKVFSALCFGSFGGFDQEEAMDERIFPFQQEGWLHRLTPSWPWSSEEQLPLHAAANFQDIAMMQYDMNEFEARRHDRLQHQDEYLQCTSWGRMKRRITRSCQCLVKPPLTERTPGSPPSPILQPLFVFVVMLAVGCSLVISSMATPAYRAQQPEPYLRTWYGQADLSFCVLLSAEFTIKIIADGFVLDRNAYIRSPLNGLEFLIMLSSWFTFSASVTTFDRASSFIRSLRALRAIRFVTLSEAMQRAIKTMFVSGTNQLLSPMFLAVIYTLPYATWDFAVFSNQTQQGVYDDQRDEIAFTLFNYMPGVYFLALLISVLGHYNLTVHLTLARRDWNELRVFLNRQEFNPIAAPRLLEAPRNFQKLCYDIAFKNHTWQSAVTLSLVMIIVLYMIERLTDLVAVVEPYLRAFAFVKLLFTTIPLVDVLFRVFALGWGGWTNFIFDMITGIGNFAATFNMIYHASNGPSIMWESVFLSGIVFKLLLHRLSFRMIARAALSCFPAILSFFGLWITALLFVTVATLQIFDVEQTSPDKFLDQKYSASWKVLMIFMKWGSGKMWINFTNQCDSQNIPSYPTRACGTPIWAYGLLVLWTLANIFISIQIFNSIILVRFSHILQFFGKFPHTLSKDDIDAFRRLWAEFSNIKNGLLERRNLMHFFSHLRGAFEVRIYPRQYSVRNIMQLCRANITSAPECTRVVDGVDLDKLGSILDTFDYNSIRRRRATYNCLYHNAFSQVPSEGISFTEMLILLAQHKLIENKSESLDLPELILQSRIDANVRDLICLDRVRSTLLMVVYRRRFVSYRLGKIGKLQKADDLGFHSISDGTLSSGTSFFYKTPPIARHFVRNLEPQMPILMDSALSKGKKISKDIHIINVCIPPADGTSVFESSMYSKTQAIPPIDPPYYVGPNIDSQ